MHLVFAVKLLKKIPAEKFKAERVRFFHGGKRRKVKIHLPKDNPAYNREHEKQACRV